MESQPIERGGLALTAKFIEKDIFWIGYVYQNIVKQAETKVSSEMTI